MATPNIRIDIASTFKDRGMKQAQRQSNLLDKSFKKLAATFLTVFSVRAITQFGKASVKAFSDDEKAVQRLTSTLNNLGMAYENPQAKAFLAQLEQTTGILDDQLRPAFQRLLQQTQSFTKSQELLTLAIDVAAGTGYDLSTVVNDLNRAYVGQTRSLSKYDIGLTQAELKGKSFLEVQKLLNDQFSGQRAAYLDTYAGKVDLLRVGYANMTEEVGRGLVDAFELLSGDAGIAGASQAMVDFGTTAGDVLRGIATLVPKVQQDINQGFSFARLLEEGARQGDPLSALLSMLQKRGQAQRPLQFPGLGVGEPALARQREQQEKIRLKREKELIALQNKAAKEAAKREAERIKREREAQALKRAGTIFDMENIQLVAAMQGQIDAEERLRLTALLALNTGNAEAAEKASKAVLMLNSASLASLEVLVEAGDSIDDVIKKLLTAQARVALIGLGITDLPDADNPFKEWDAIIAKILGDLAKIQASLNFKMTVDNKTITPEPPPSQNPFYNIPIGSEGDYITLGANKKTQIPSTPTSTVNMGTGVLAGIDLNQLVIGGEGDYLPINARAQSPVNITINMNAPVLTENDLIDVVQDGLYKAQRNGKGVLFGSVQL